MPQANHAKPLSICFVHDDRIGHQKQLRGLENQLMKRALCTTHWVDQQSVALLNHALRFDICIGAGHKTHWPLWRLARRHRAFSVVLMTPSLPMFLFDAVICPRHDDPRESSRVFVTKGPINTIQHLTTPDRKPYENAPDRSPQHNLILLGGPSKHFNWSSERILTTVKQLVRHDTDLPWLLSPSRRTPDTTIERIKAELPKLRFLSASHDLDQAIHRAKQVWVSADSSNMIYEALSAAKPTGVIELATRHKLFRKNRLRNELERLYRENHVMRLADLSPESDINNRQQTGLHEAERATEWLLMRYETWRSKHEGQDV
ncbi:hypothetical protein A3758_11365 [Oleiphilus sp. HI0118]|nr:hypothetical protein A3758_11365 [Oleiphilus sp. HI0118]